MAALQLQLHNFIASKSRKIRSSGPALARQQIANLWPDWLSKKGGEVLLFKSTTQWPNFFPLGNLITALPFPNTTYCLRTRLSVKVNIQCTQKPQQPITEWILLILQLSVFFLLPRCRDINTSPIRASALAATLLPTPAHLHNFSVEFLVPDSLPLSPLSYFITQNIQCTSPLQSHDTQQNSFNQIATKKMGMTLHI